MTRVPRSVRRIGLLFLAVVAVEYVAVHLLAGAVRSWPTLGGAAPALVAGALVAELASLACYSGLTRRLLTAPRPPFSSVLAIDVTGNGFSHVVPGGGAAALALRIRLYDRAGVAPVEAMGAAAVQYAVVLVWLLVVILLGLVLSVPGSGSRSVVSTVSVAAVSLTALGGLMAVLAVRSDQLTRVSHALGRRIPLARPTAVEGMARALAARVRLLLTSPRTSRGAALWAAAYWSCDALSLLLSLWAFGHAPGPGALLMTYAVVSLLALVPLTPGGLGLVEGVAVPLLVSLGAPHGAALLGVLTWRLFGFWLTIPLGVVTWCWLTIGHPTDRAGT